MTCSGASNETCGATNAIEVLNFTCTGKPLPNYKGCVSSVAKALPYCDETKSFDERVSDLVGRLSLADKIAMISPQPVQGLCSTPPFSSVAPRS
jgi:hypothetical protein